MVTGLTNVDFKKYFDVINHELFLLKKLNGASDFTVKWFVGIFTRSGSKLLGNERLRL